MYGAMCQDNDGLEDELDGLEAMEAECSYDMSCPPV